MADIDRWLLPEGIEEVFPEKARQLEAMRRALLDLFDSWGYDLVMPPMVEFLDALKTGLGQDLDLQTFKLTDQLTGRLMGLRADMTPQVARIESHYIKREAPVRLCYLGPVLRTRPGVFGGSREPLQMGAELFGHVGVQSDVEIVHLLITALELIGIPAPNLGIGHVGIYRELVNESQLEADTEEVLFDALRRKSKPDVQAFLTASKLGDDYKRMFAGLIDLNGEVAEFGVAQAALSVAGPKVQAALQNLEQVIALAAKTLPGLKLYYDLADLRGYRYHTGMVFSAYVAGYGEAIANGGRYDAIGEAFGRARPATGFSADLRILLRMLVDKDVSGIGILAPEDGDSALIEKIQSLRGSGERVIRALPGVADAIMTCCCDRKLEKQDNCWQVVPL
ncbi:MAG TPA: ATP phosphoribosyltransferase regulatory subunit [Acidiferrobacteraceae bacterium]|nr:ATP phosphoribosyltransferase regulatory subunit [Acidiferrobacteraceae bacterium]